MGYNACPYGAHLLGEFMEKEDIILTDSPATSTELSHIEPGTLCRGQLQLALHLPELLRAGGVRLTTTGTA